MKDLTFPSLDIYGEGGALAVVTFFFFVTLAIEEGHGNCRCQLIFCNTLLKRRQ